MREPGIYFGLPEAEYHATPALSNSGIQNLLISPLDFWARSWMNPTYEHEETEFTRKGSAYHKRILEGREAFEASYAAALNPDDYPDALKTTDDIKAQLRVHGEKLSGRKDELIERLLTHDPTAPIWAHMLSEHGKANHGKEIIPQSWIDEIEISAAHIDHHPELGKAFSGGHPEVSIFWETEGIPMKARLDYLKPRAVVDLKTFSNPLGKPIDRAIAGAMASGRYHIQAYVYLEAVAAAKKHIHAGQVIWHESTKMRDYEKGPPDLADETTFLFVFQQTGIAPVARGKVFPKRLVYDCAAAAVKEARYTFNFYTEKFGADPWVDQSRIDTFADEDFPIWMTET
ncbi:MAG: PD-(D/E)XK nuclease-like domain-containing protein [Methyloceanibacter sp.]|nr:PD-(D/E)XK nuclease-like domain-containing protein [Methyloceanibacter sp.]